MSLRFRQSMTGSVEQVLFEEEEDGYYTGHTPNYVKVYARGKGLHNEILPVEITEPYRDGVLGRILSPSEPR